MQKLSNGMDSTLGNWRIMAASVFGENAPAVKFLDAKIAEQGKDEEVIADEHQVMVLLLQIQAGA